MAYPEPVEVSPWYLRNITQALELDSVTGQVHVRSSIVGGNVTIAGNVIVSNVTVDGIGNIDVSGNTMPVSGNINIDAGNVTVLQGTDPWIVEGNVNANVTGNVNIDNTVEVTQGTDPWIVSGNVGITGTASVAFADEATDAFGRLRVSNPYTLYDTQARYYDHEQFSSNIAGTANVVYNSNSSTFELNVGTGVNDSVLRETTKTFPYQPGKSLLIFHTFCMNTPKANLRQRAGYFSQDNGIFFEVNGTTLNMVIRSKSTGIVVEDRIAQANWNGDRLNGAGGAYNPSGITLNPALDQIWFCDIEWLGVGSVRVGFVINGIFITCHTFNHANTPSTLTADNTTTYMTTATLPLRYEITNTGATASASMLRQICSSVLSEGGFQLTGSGNPRAASHIIGSPVRLPNDNSFLPVIAIRLKSTMLDAVVVPINYSLVPVSQSIFQFRVYKRAITSGGTWVDSAADSAVQYNLAPTALVSGDIAEQSFINSSNQSSSAPTQEAFGFEYQLEREPFTGTPYEYVIMMATTGTNMDVYASLEWQEIT
jgi:hypothetical protein